MRNLFWYRKFVKIEKKMEPDGKAGFREVEPEREEVVWECFNLDCVVRGIWHTDNLFMVLLNDGHEQSQDAKVPILDKNGKVKGVEVKRVRDWFYSQIELNREDALRFWDESSIGGADERKRYLGVKLGKGTAV